MIRHLASFYKCPLSENMQQSATNIDIAKLHNRITQCVYKPHVTIIAASCVLKNEYGTRWLLNHNITLQIHSPVTEQMDRDLNK